MSKVNEQVISKNEKTSVKCCKNVLQQKKPSDTLNNIHNEFVAMPLEKANGDFVFICQQFYTFDLIKKTWIRLEYK